MIKEKIFLKLGIHTNRTKNITSHVLMSFVYKGGSIISNFLVVPISINYLSASNYGIWLTLSSFIAWFSFFDIGLGQGLRNKFAEATANGDTNLAKAYVSTAYYTIGIVSLVLLILFWVVNFFIDWKVVFNTELNVSNELSLLMPIVFSFFAIQLVAKLITTIYTADQHHSMQGKVNFYTQAVSLLLIWLVTHFTKSSLFLFGLIFSATPVLVLLYLNFFAFSKKYKKYKPSIKLFRKDFLKNIFGLGFKFFIIQLAGIILFSTDNFIITQLFGPAEVVPYNIAFKYFGISNMVMSIIVTPYWSSITEAYTKKDFQWIKKSMKNLVIISLIIVGTILLMLLIASPVYKVWLGNKLDVPLLLNISMAIFFIINTLFAPFTNFINGTGKVTLQFVSLLVTAIINIPLSIWLSRTFYLGSSGVIIATNICLIPHLILCPFQYYKIVNEKAKGIWNI